MKYGILFFLANLFLLPSSKAQYQTVPLSGFNADVVADVVGNAAGSTTASYDASNYVFMSPVYNPTGTSLPATGLINSVVATTPGMQFQLASYAANNDMHLTTNQTGALTFVTATQTKELYLLGSTGQGFSNANITVTFTDASTQSFTNINFQDWYNGSDFAIKGMGRVLKTTNAITNDTNNPRIYQVKLDLLTSNYYKFIQSVSFTNTVTTSAVLNIMAISIKPPPILYPYDPAVSFISKPSGNCFTATQIISARLKNMGANPINLSVNPVTLSIHVTGPAGLVTHSIVVSSGVLNALGVDSMLVIFNGANTFNLFNGGTYHINSSLTISGLVNGTLQNDSLSTGHTLINYRPSPGPDYHLCQGSSIPFGQGLAVQGCSTPLLDSATITFSIGTGCTDNAGSTGTGGSLGLPANCENQYACLFATGVVPALPTGAFFTQPATLNVTNLQLNSAFSTFYANANQVRFCLYGNAPVPPYLYSPGAQGANGTFPFNYNRQIPAADMAAIYSGLLPGSILNMGYWETWNDNSALADITNNSGGTTVATLKFYYYYYLPSFEWYDVLSGGSTLYALSPFNPLSVNNLVVNNSNTVGNYTFYVACSGTSTCRTPVHLLIDSTPVSYPTNVNVCEGLSGSNSGVVNLTSLNNIVSGGIAGVSVNYFSDQGLFAPITYPSADTTGSTVVYAKVTNISTGCISSDSVTITVNSRPDIQPEPMFGLTCNCIDVVSLINPFSTIPLGSDTTYFSNPACTITHPNPHVICTADSVYIIVKTNTTPSCADTAEAFVDLSPGSSMIANQTSNNTSICNAIPVVNNTISDGSSLLFYNPIDCKKLATVTDLSNGISMGSTSVEEVIDCGIPTYNGQPYLARYYHIEPAVQDSGFVCLYYLQSDIQDYNFVAASTSWPLMDTNTLANFCISKVDNGDLFAPNHTWVVIPEASITKTYDPVTTIWSACFHVDSFSYFYAHTTNLNNAALPVVLKSFSASKNENAIALNWVTSQEKNNDYFIVERSRDGKNFYTVSEKIKSKGLNGNSDIELNYNLTDQTPLRGNNYYRLLQTDKDGRGSYSKTVSIFFGEENNIRIYPNPVQEFLTVGVSVTKPTTAKVQIVDAISRVLIQLNSSLAVGENEISIPTQQLATGTYFLKMNYGNGSSYSEIFVKQ
jgi:Secretion system C-terminal sorting domain